MRDFLDLRLRCVSFKVSLFSKVVRNDTPHPHAQSWIRFGRRLPEKILPRAWTIAASGLSENLA